MCVRKLKLLVNAPSCVIALVLFQRKLSFKFDDGVSNFEGVFSEHLDLDVMTRATDEHEKPKIRLEILENMVL